MSDDLRAALEAKRGYPVSRPGTTMATGGTYPESTSWRRDPFGAYVGFEDAWDVVLLALASSDGLDVARLGEAMSNAWPAEEQLVDDSEVWHRFAPLVAREYAALRSTPEAALSKEGTPHE